MYKIEDEEQSTQHKNSLHKDMDTAKLTAVTAGSLCINSIRSYFLTLHSLSNIFSYITMNLSAVYPLT